MMRSRTQQQGFTLIEVLVAILIFGLIGIGAFGTLRAAQDAQQSLRERGERFFALQRAITTLSNDYQQRAARRVRDSYGDRRPLILGSSDENSSYLAFTRSGWRNPAQLPRSTLEYVRYALEDGQLVRYSHLLLDQAQQPVIQRRILLDGVNTMSIRFRPANAGAAETLASESLSDEDDTGESWPQEWPVGGRLNSEDSDKAPSAVRISLDVEGIGEVHRVLL